MKYFKKNNKKFGFSLLELVLAVAIFSLGSVAIATMLIDSNLSTRLAGERVEALSYAKEGVEAVFSIRNASSTTWLAQEDGDKNLYYGDSGWTFSETPDLLNDKYTRVVNILASTTATTTRDVSVNVSWFLTPGRMATVTLQTLITNWK